MKHAILAMGPDDPVTSARFFWTGMAASWTGCYRMDLKYAIVRSRPSSKGTVGAQASEERANAISGWRWRGSSCGSGRNASFERLPSVSASSRPVRAW